MRLFIYIFVLFFLMSCQKYTPNHTQEDNISENIISSGSWEYDIAGDILKLTDAKPIHIIDYYSSTPDWENIIVWSDFVIADDENMSILQKKISDLWNRWDIFIQNHVNANIVNDIWWWLTDPKRSLHIKMHQKFMSSEMLESLLGADISFLYLELTYGSNGEEFCDNKVIFSHDVAQQIIHANNTRLNISFANCWYGFEWAWDAVQFNDTGIIWDDRVVFCEDTCRF